MKKSNRREPELTLRLKYQDNFYQKLKFLVSDTVTGKLIFLFWVFFVSQFFIYKLVFGPVYEGSVPDTSYASQWVELFALTPRNGIISVSLLTSLFSHGNPLHLVLNSLVLLSFGLIIESDHQKRNYLLLFIISGILTLIAQGSIVQFAMNTDFLRVGINGQIPILGSSGAIASIIGATAMKRPRAEAYVLIAPSISVNLLATCFIIFGVSLMAVLTLGTVSLGIAHTAHITGLIIGIFYGRARYGKWRAEMLVYEKLESWKRRI